jgi:hypothetical protein
MREFFGPHAGVLLARAARARSPRVCVCKLLTFRFAEMRSINTKHYAASIGVRRGWVFEVHHAASFNMRALLAGSPFRCALRAAQTAGSPPRCH